MVKEETLTRDQSITVNIGELRIVIKHNDIGVSIDYFAKYPLDDILIREETMYFDDVHDAILKDAKEVS